MSPLEWLLIVTVVSSKRKNSVLAFAGGAVVVTGGVLGFDLPPAVATSLIASAALANTNIAKKQVKNRFLIDIIAPCSGTRMKIHDTLVRACRHLSQARAQTKCSPAR